MLCACYLSFIMHMAVVRNVCHYSSFSASRNTRHYILDMWKPLSEIRTQGYQESITVGGNAIIPTLVRLKARPMLAVLPLGRPTTA